VAGSRQRGVTQLFGFGAFFRLTVEVKQRQVLPIAAAQPA
jgi:hypothetical protein